MANADDLALQTLWYANGLTAHEAYERGYEPNIPPEGTLEREHFIDGWRARKAIVEGRTEKV